MFEDDEIRLRHILDAAREAVSFTGGIVVKTWIATGN